MKNMGDKVLRKLKSEKIGIHVVCHSLTFTTREPNSGDEWDRGDSDTTHDIIGIKSNQKQAVDLIADFQPLPETDYYLVSVISSSGDSFGHDSNRNIDFIDLYETREEAELLYEKIESFSRDEFVRRNRSHKASENDYKFEYQNPAGFKKVMYTYHWFDYFGGYSYTDITVVRLITIR